MHVVCDVATPRLHWPLMQYGVSGGHSLSTEHVLPICAPVAGVAEHRPATQYGNGCGFAVVPPDVFAAHWASFEHTGAVTHAPVDGQHSWPAGQLVAVHAGPGAALFGCPTPALAVLTHVPCALHA